MKLQVAILDKNIVVDAVYTDGQRLSAWQTRQPPCSCLAALDLIKCAWICMGEQHVPRLPRTSSADAPGTGHLLILNGLSDTVQLLHALSETDS